MENPVAVTQGRKRTGDEFIPQARHWSSKHQRGRGNPESSWKRQESNSSKQRLSKPHAPPTMLPAASCPLVFWWQTPVPPKPGLPCPASRSAARCLLLALLFSRCCPQQTRCSLLSPHAHILLPAMVQISSSHPILAPNTPGQPQSVEPLQ